MRVRKMFVCELSIINEMIDQLDACFLFLVWFNLPGAGSSDEFAGRN